MMNKTTAIQDNKFSNLRTTLLVALVLMLGACGFHLRNAGSIPDIYHHLQIKAPKDSLLTKWLRAELIGMQVQLDEPNSPVLHILAIRPTRQELAGSLTEITIGVEVDFRMEDALGNPLSTTRTIISHRSFQYDQITVGIPSQQEDLLQTDLYQGAAQQIVRMLATGRLPAATKSAS